VLHIGDISRYGGGKYDRHAEHQRECDVDVRPISHSANGAQCTIAQPGVYSRGYTTEFVKLAFALGARKILFNDTACGTRPCKGHDNHLHVSFD